MSFGDFFKALTTRPSGRTGLTPSDWRATFSVSDSTFSERLDAMRHAPPLTWSTAAEARNCLAEIRLREQALHMLKRDIKLHMQHVRQEYVTKRATVRTVPFLKYQATMRANDRRYLTQREHKDLAPYEQLTREVDALIQQLEYTKLTINQWMIADK